MTPAPSRPDRYSREFESEADEFAFALLKQHGMSPEGFADIMLRMSELNKKADKMNQLDFCPRTPFEAAAAQE